MNSQQICDEFLLINSKKSKGILYVDNTISNENIIISDYEGSLYFVDLENDYKKPFINKTFQNFLKYKEKAKIFIKNINNNYYIFESNQIETNRYTKKLENEIIIHFIKFPDNYNDFENINIYTVTKIKLNSDVIVTQIEISNKKDILIAMNNGSIAIYNHFYDIPEYIIDAHYKSITGFVWMENEKYLVTVSEDKNIKSYQFPIKWPAEFIRKNQEDNKINILDEIKSDTKDIYNEVFYAEKNNSNNLFNNVNNENNNFSNNNNNSSNNNSNNNNQYIWDIGNDNCNYEINKNDNYSINNNRDIKNSETDLFFDENKSNDSEEEDEEDLYNHTKNLFIQKQQKLLDKKENEYKGINKEIEEKKIYDKPNKYEDYYHIFSDDIDGWSKNLV